MLVMSTFRTRPNRSVYFKQLLNPRISVHQQLRPLPSSPSGRYMPGRPWIYTHVIRCPKAISRHGFTIVPSKSLEGALPALLSREDPKPAVHHLHTVAVCRRGQRCLQTKSRRMASPLDSITQRRRRVVGELRPQTTYIGLHAGGVPQPCSVLDPASDGTGTKRPQKTPNQIVDGPGSVASAARGAPSGVCRGTT